MPKLKYDHLKRNGGKPKGGIAAKGFRDSMRGTQPEKEKPPHNPNGTILDYSGVKHNQPEIIEGYSKKSEGFGRVNHVGNTGSYRGPYTGDINAFRVGRSYGALGETFARDDTTKGNNDKGR